MSNSLTLLSLVHALIVFNVFDLVFFIKGQHVKFVIKLSYELNEYKNFSFAC